MKWTEAYGMMIVVDNNNNNNKLFIYDPISSATLPVILYFFVALHWLTTTPTNWHTHIHAYFPFIMKPVQHDLYAANVALFYDA